MRRIALAMTMFAVLAFGATQAQAQHPRHHHGRSHSSYRYAPPRHYHHHGPRYGYPAPMVRPYYGPRWVAPVPVYPYPYYYGPSSGFYYRGSGVSIGIGF